MHLSRCLLLLCSLATLAARAEPLTPDQARAAVPRADLSALTDAQRGTFVQVAGDVFGYAGCRETLRACLGAGQKDPHAVRMSVLLAKLIEEGATATVATDVLEKYYASFQPSERVALRTDDCPLLGEKGARVTVVEFSDFQCSHCAAAVAPLRDLVERDEKGRARLCFKHFPLSFHPRARLAAVCAEYARAHHKFFELADRLFAHQEALEDADLKSLAAEAGLDGAAMLQEAYAGKFDGPVESHLRQGTAAGVEGTPTLFLNGRPFRLPVRPFYLKFAVEDELERSREKRAAAPARAAAGRRP